MPNWLYPTIGVIHPYIGGWAATALTRKEVKSWYPTLKKSKLTPPDWVFGPVWASLYGSMGYAAFMIWRDGGGFSGAARLPLCLYGTQLMLNWAWSPLFFGYHKLGLAALNIPITVGFVVGCVITFRPINATASNLMIPYLAWISFASYLCAKIYLLNPDKRE